MAEPEHVLERHLALDQIARIARGADAGLELGKDLLIHRLEAEARELAVLEIAVGHQPLAILDVLTVAVDRQDHVVEPEMGHQHKRLGRRLQRFEPGQARIGLAAALDDLGVERGLGREMPEYQGLGDAGRGRDLAGRRADKALAGEQRQSRRHDRLPPLFPVHPQARHGGISKRSLTSCLACAGNNFCRCEVARPARLSGARAARGPRLRPGAKAV